MGRPQRPLDPEAGPLQRFAFELRQLRQAAGGPSYRQLSKRAHYSVTTLSEAAGGEVFPTLEVTLAYVEACGGDREAWESRWRETAATISARQKTASAAEDPTKPEPSPPRNWAQRWVSHPRLAARSQKITVTGLMVGAALAIILLLGIATAVSNSDPDPATAAPGRAVPGPGPVSGRAPAVITEDAVCSDPVRIPLEKRSGPGSAEPDI